jgi:tetratricopeptide (TPR) repeat protein
MSSDPSRAASRSRIRLARWTVPAFAAGLLLPGTSAPASAQSQGDEVIDLSTSSDAAKNHFWAGVEDSQNVFPAGARRHLELAIGADPSFGLAHVTLAFVAAVPNDERVAMMTKGFGLMDEATTDELLLATAFRAWRSGGQPEASRILALLSRMNSDDPHVLVWATQIANARGDRTNPAERQRRIIERFPDYAPPHNLLAYALWGQGNKNGALNAVRDYVRLAPDHPNAHDSYAEMLQGVGRYQEALMHYARAVELDEGYEVGYTGAAEVHALMGEYEQAAAKMLEAADHAGTPQARVNHLRGAASAYTLGGNRSKAMETLASAAAFAEGEDLGGNAGFVHLQMAVTAPLLGRDGEIGAHLSRAGELGPQNPAFYGMSALAHGAAGHVDAARASASQIPESNANWTSAGHAAVALALVEQGDLDGALEELSSARAGDPLADAVRGLCLDKMGRDAEAGAGLADVSNVRQFALANPLQVFAKYLAGQT